MRSEGIRLYAILNSYWEPLKFELPPLPDRNEWRRWIDTALESPQDIVPWQEAAGVAGCCYRAEARSVVMLFAIAAGANSP